MPFKTLSICKIITAVVGSVQKGRPAINIFKSWVLTDFFGIWSEPTPSLINRLNCTLPKKGCVGSLIVSHRIFQGWWNDNWVVDYWPQTNFSPLDLLLKRKKIPSRYTAFRWVNVCPRPAPNRRLRTSRAWLELRCTISKQERCSLKKSLQIHRQEATFVNSTFYSITIRCLSLWATLSKIIRRDANIRQRERLLMKPQMRSLTTDKGID